MAMTSKRKFKALFKTPFVDAIVDCWALLLGMGIVMVAYGLQGPLLGLRAISEGFSPSLTGVIMSSYFIGFVFGSKATPVFVSRVGHVRVFAALASLVSVSALLHALYISPMVWMMMRFVTGGCFAGLYIIAESWLNESITNDTRGQLLSVYMVITLGSMGSGPLLLNVGDPVDINLFILVSILFSIAVVPILLTAGRMPVFETPQTIKLSQITKDVPLGLAGCLITGISNGAIIGMGAVYAESVGLSLTQVSLFMSAAIWGGVLFQWPIGTLSDKFDRRFILTVVTFIAAIVAAFALVVHLDNPLAHLAVIGLLGGMSFPMYSLTLAMINDRLLPEQMVAASSSLVLLVGVGAFFGSLVAGSAINYLGAPGFLILLATVHSALGIYAVYRMRSVPTVPLEEQGPPVYIARTSPVGAAVAFEEDTEEKNP